MFGVDRGVEDLGFAATEAAVDAEIAERNARLRVARETIVGAHHGVRLPLQHRQRRGVYALVAGGAIAGTKKTNGIFVEHPQKGRT